MSKEFIQALLLHEKVSALLIGLQIEAKKLNQIFVRRGGIVGIILL